MNSTNTLSKREKLRSRKEILSVQNRGTKIHTKDFILVYRALEGDTSRFAVTVSKKVDKRAVVRNKIKRQVRALFRTHKKFFNNSIEIVYIAKRNAKNCDYKEIKRQIIGSLRYHKVIHSEGKS